jgi:UDP-N-acetylmuramate dehydrogenase
MRLDYLQDLNVKITPKALLRDFTTFRLGGPCLALVECANAGTVLETIKRLRLHKQDFLLMGFGSNILASDHGVQRLIVRYTSMEPIIKLDSGRLIADAATQFDDLVFFAIQHGLGDMTKFSGIPGTLGGAIAGNAGAYGRQVSDHLVELTVLTTEDQVVTIPKSDVHFEYRDSNLKHNGSIILSAVFELPQGDINSMLKEREETLAIRKKKHGTWQENPSAGSFFKNIEPTSKAGQRQAAGWFLEESGAKAMRVGKAHPYENHANIVTNDEGATAQDVYELTRRMAAAVKEKFALDLVREVRLLGSFDHAHKHDENGFW